MVGKKIMIQDLGLVNGVYHQNLNVSEWSAGIYFVNFYSSDGGTISKKINVVK
jgi:hypothetical protein